VKKAIIVVGMHRSGTSAISGLLNELGVFMGQNLYGPQAGVNEKGFFENAKVVELNDLLFDELLQSWDDPLAYNFNNSYHQTYDAFYDSTIEFIESEYGNHTLWGMKDPRTSLHLPFWHKIITQLNVEPCYLMMVRNPIEVAASLTKRDSFSLKKSTILWLNYTFSTYISCKNEKLVIIDFDKLISSPEQTLDLICKKINIDLPEQQSTFIESKLRNNKSGIQENDELSRLALATYQELCKPDYDETVIDNLLSEYHNYLTGIDLLFKEHCQTIKKEEVRYRKLFLNAYNSTWWKLARPLKKLEEIIRS
jgi:hypothetical protein